jgi:hypothetical protein
VDGIACPILLSQLTTVYPFRAHHFICKQSSLSPMDISIVSESNYNATLSGIKFV